MSNQASAIVIADSISPDGVRLTTFQMRYWRGIHSELMTHRTLSRNAGSSRARPSQKIIDQVRKHPWGPIHWGANQAGMQAHTELSEADIRIAKTHWSSGAWKAASAAQAMLDLGVHKQIVNRLLEPFTYIDVVVTATDYANFFMLRDHPDAQPEIQELARLMKAAMNSSTPEHLDPGEWHLPYIASSDWSAATRYCQDGRVTRDMPTFDEVLEVVRKISVARCARVSYKAFDGTIAPIEKDLELFNRLLISQPLHASPAEHQATPDENITEYSQANEWSMIGWQKPQLHGNFRGWCQYRKMLPNEFLNG